MFRVSAGVRLLGAGLILTGCWATFASGQISNNPFTDGQATRLDQSGDAVPPTAMLTERGRQLVVQLRNLRRTEAGLGAKHPSLINVQEEIEAVKLQLDAWTPGNDDPDKPLAESLPEMNASDMQQLILRMAVKMDRLEGRIVVLERRAHKVRPR